ncbi:11776_t:CDS:2, partial [Gigaspora margarita]
DDNQKLEKEINLLQNNEFKESFNKADVTFNSLYIQYLEAIENNNKFEVSSTTFDKIWRKFLPYIKKLTPHSDLYLKCKDMQFNVIYWSVKEKEEKVLEWNEHIE